MSRLQFKLEAQASGSHARAGSFHTLHGEVRTPIFMPVGTQATVKSQSVDDLARAGSRMLLANTYHLMLRPGVEVFRKFGGIHRFMNWSGPVLTDSGGFQIFSLPHSREMTEDGARFQSYVDGKMHLLSPEESIGVQRAIGSDVMMVLDQCIPSTASHDHAKAAMELTHRWAVRSLAARGDSLQSMFGIVQGACFHDLRRQSADFITNLPFDGFAIGGLAVGETKDHREEFVEATASLLPSALPRYLMGVGTPIDILEAVHRGVDMFDCIIPTSLAQRGVAFTSHGKLQLRRGVYKLAEDKLDARCDCRACSAYSRAYLHHLIKSDEVLGWQLLSTHNLTFYHRLMSDIRQAIFDDSFAALYRTKREELMCSDEDNPVEPPVRRKPRGIRGASLGDYTVDISPQGYARIRQLSSGEIMHSVSDPKVEANLLYVEQARLAERLCDDSGEPLVIWDVGLGAASNAMAALRCFEEVSQKGVKTRPLHLVSFECDLDPLRLAAKQASLFPHLHHPAPHRLLEKGTWSHPKEKMKWELLEGDFIDKLECAPAPDLIYYDPFSYKTDSALWTAEVFTKVRRRCDEKVASLFTYSASTAVRVALLMGGFYVGRGVATPPKAETTVAWSKLTPEVQERLLDRDWLKRWERSDARLPSGASPDQVGELEARIRNHPQFTQLSRG